MVFLFNSLCHHFSIGLRELKRIYPRPPKNFHCHLQMAAERLLFPAISSLRNNRPKTLWGHQNSSIVRYIIYHPIPQSIVIIFFCTQLSYTGWWYTYPSEKLIIIPNIWKVIKAMFQTTNQTSSI